MVSARMGGLAVALGLGYAVVAATGVASADPSDAASSAHSSSSSQAGASASSASNSAGPSSAASAAGTSKRSVRKAREAKRSSEAGDGKEDRRASVTSGTGGRRDSATDQRDADVDTDAEVDRPDPGEDAEDGPAPASVDVASDEPEQKGDVPPLAAADVPEAAETARAEPQPAPQPASAAADNVIEMASPVAPDALAESPAEVPTEPAAAPAVWTLAAAARRELTGDSFSVAQAADADPDSPSVMAIEQVAPLAFIQRVPVLGPVFFTPMVALLHQIPIVGDVLHPLFGYPVRRGTADGAPVPRDVRVISADGTQIYVHFMPAAGLGKDQQAPTVLNGPGLGAPGATNIDGTFLDPLLADFVGIMGVGTLRQAGYNVVTWDPRGEWRSGGALELNAAELRGP